ncbi:GNAT family N-acetyltransferase [Nocardioides sp. CFH 31398]|uniref:GNAT family N-acetyltransferase n=1 Tax=Nocardioides sp. CFH 31398 TaxID=2919579 RepID=UPI001F065AF1|nr:GNAT family protein [Nocardioides sp. CFH 31398]MCH1867310.1 GNAT family N-acetyltransferase [Nocardioides sp. CFH 31398]
MLDWTPPATLTATRLEGTHVVLEPLAVDHAEALQVAIGDSGTSWRFLPVEAPGDVATMRALVEEQLADPGLETFVVRPGGGAVAGRVSWMRQDPAHGCAEVGWVVFGPTLQRTAAATETVSLLLRQAFDAGYRRVEWKCDDLNEPSKRAAVRLGFTAEGVFRQHRVVKGLNRDTAWFAMLDREWPVVRAAHEAWLAPSTFDEHGHQRHPLTVQSAFPAVG